MADRLNAPPPDTTQPDTATAKPPDRDCAHAEALDRLYGLLTAGENCRYRVERGAYLFFQLPKPEDMPWYVGKAGKRKRRPLPKPRDPKWPRWIPAYLEVLEPSRLQKMHAQEPDMREMALRVAALRLRRRDWKSIAQQVSTDERTWQVSELQKLIREEKWIRRHAFRDHVQGTARLALCAPKLCPWLVFDVDCHVSDDHPDIEQWRRDRDARARLIIAWCRSHGCEPVAVSSPGNGLHIWLRLPGRAPRQYIANAAKAALTDWFADRPIALEHVDIFPSKNGIRLPCGVRQVVLDADTLQPIAGVGTRKRRKRTENLQAFVERLERAILPINALRQHGARIAAKPTPAAPASPTPTSAPCTTNALLKGPEYWARVREILERGIDRPGTRHDATYKIGFLLFVALALPRSFVEHWTIEILGRHPVQSNSPDWRSESAAGLRDYLHRWDAAATRGALVRGQTLWGNSAHQELTLLPPEVIQQCLLQRPDFLPGDPTKRRPLSSSLSSLCVPVPQWVTEGLPPSIHDRAHRLYCELATGAPIRQLSSRYLLELCGDRHVRIDGKRKRVYLVIRRHFEAAGALRLVAGYKIKTCGKTWALTPEMFSTATTAEPATNTDHHGRAGAHDPDATSTETNDPSVPPPSSGPLLRGLERATDNRPMSEPKPANEPATTADPTTNTDGPGRAVIHDPDAKSTQHPSPSVPPKERIAPPLQRATAPIVRPTGPRLGVIDGDGQPDPRPEIVVQVDDPELAALITKANASREAAALRDRAQVVKDRPPPTPTTGLIKVAADRLMESYERARRREAARACPPGPECAPESVDASPGSPPETSPDEWSARLADAPPDPAPTDQAPPDVEEFDLCAHLASIEWVSLSMDPTYDPMADTS